MPTLSQSLSMASSLLTLLMDLNQAAFSSSFISHGFLWVGSLGVCPPHLCGGDGFFEGEFAFAQFEFLFLDRGHALMDFDPGCVIEDGENTFELAEVFTCQGEFEGPFFHDFDGSGIEPGISGGD